MGTKSTEGLKNPALHRSPIAAKQVRRVGSIVGSALLGMVLFGCSTMNDRINDVLGKGEPRSTSNSGRPTSSKPASAPIPKPASKQTSTSGQATKQASSPATQSQSQQPSNKGSSESEEELRKSSEDYINKLVIQASIEQGLFVGAMVLLNCKLSNSKNCTERVIGSTLLMGAVKYMENKETMSREGDIQAAEAMAKDAKEEVARLRKATADARQVAEKNALEMKELENKIAQNQITTAQARAEAKRFKENTKIVGEMVKKGSSELEAWESVLKRQEKAGKPSAELRVQVQAKREQVRNLENTYASMQKNLESFEIRTG